MLVEDQIVQALKCVDLPKDLIVIKGDRDGVEPKAPYLLIQTVSDWTTATSTTPTVIRMVATMKEFIKQNTIVSHLSYTPQQKAVTMIGLNDSTEV